MELSRECCTELQSVNLDGVWVPGVKAIQPNTKHVYTKLSLSEMPSLNRPTRLKVISMGNPLVGKTTIIKRCAHFAWLIAAVEWSLCPSEHVLP